jgi:hypothetical protein
MAMYIIAVKRDRRVYAPPDWAKPLQAINGLKICGSGNPFRVQVEASDDAIEEVRRELGELCHIESVIPHQFT